MQLSYIEAVEMASVELKKISNVRAFCQEHKIGYTNTMQIKNKSTQKHFPLLIVKILAIFGKNFTIITTFKENDHATT